MFKKLIITIFTLLVLSLPASYVVLFTTWGNNFVANTVQEKVNTTAPIDFKISEFTLTTSKLVFKSSIDSTSIIEIEGSISPFALSFDLNYLLDIKDLSKLEKFTAQKLQGAFKTNGSVKGNKDKLLVNGVTDLFKSNSTYDVVLNNFSVTKIDVLFKNIDIADILYTINQPIYASGLVNIKANIKDIALVNLTGDIVTTIHSGKLNNPIINTNFNQKLKGEKLFSGEVVTQLKPMLIDNKIALKTSFADIEMQSAKINLKNIHITSDYKVVVQDLNNLFDFTQMPLKGDLVLNGEVKKQNDLEVTGASNTLGGSLDFKLFNDDFNANLNNLKVLEITKMLTYPDFFSSNINGVMNYNIKSQQGTINAKLNNGYFTETKFTKLIDKLTKDKMSGSVYDDFEVNSQIDKKLIHTQVALKDSKSTIDVPNSTIDLDKQTVNAVANITYKQYELGSTITGAINNPNIKLDTSKIVKQVANEKLDQEIEKIKQKDEKKGKVLEGLKSIFGNN